MGRRPFDHIDFSSYGFICGVVDFWIIAVILWRWYQETTRLALLQRHKGVIVRRHKVYPPWWCVPQYIIEYAFKIQEGKSNILVDGYIRQSNHNAFNLHEMILEYYGKNTYQSLYVHQLEFSPKEWQSLDKGTKVTVWFDEHTKQSVATKYPLYTNGDVDHFYTFAATVILMSLCLPLFQGLDLLIVHCTLPLLVRVLLRVCMALQYVPEHIYQTKGYQKWSRFRDGVLMLFTPRFDDGFEQCGWMKRMD